MDSIISLITVINKPNKAFFYKIWDGAKDYCSKLGGYLVVIESAEEDNFVYNSVFLPRHNPAILLGATDQDDEGHWFWVTGEELQYTNWAEGEPNNCGGLEESGKCAPENSITYHPDHPSQWNDVPSYNGGNYLCEFES